MFPNEPTKDYCVLCKKEIEWLKKLETPDLDYYGKVFKGTDRYWHARCLAMFIDFQNKGISDDEE